MIRVCAPASATIGVVDEIEALLIKHLPAAAKWEIHADDGDNEEDDQGAHRYSPATRATW